MVTYGVIDYGTHNDDQLLVIAHTDVRAASYKLTLLPMSTSMSINLLSFAMAKTWS